MKRRTVRILCGAVALGLLFGGVTLGATLVYIHQSARHYSEVAQQAHPHPGDDVAALIDFMESDAHVFRDRNLAIWTLGRLQDTKALPALVSVYTDEQCEHEKNLCQYELEKAIKRCGGITNPLRKAKH